MFISLSAGRLPDRHMTSGICCPGNPRVRRLFEEKAMGILGYILGAFGFIAFG